ncbi:MAG TPA: hypothetical protein VGX03_09020 [Candidatus Binatia bacterium]|nr:hypothetical protein [Candidatus Binatia bacterium]
METTPVLSPDHLNSPAAIVDPYPFYHHLREQSPVNYSHMPGGIFPGMDEPIRAWALMKYDDVYGALRDHDTFSSARRWRGLRRRSLSTPFSTGSRFSHAAVRLRYDRPEVPSCSASNTCRSC